MAINMIDKCKCSGCHACVNACPTQCISMICDEEGFLYPSVNTAQCIDCKKCEKVCPFLKTESNRIKVPKTFAVKIKDDEIRKQSSSGGVFSALADYVFDKGGVVYGAAMTDDLKGVCHIRVDNRKELYRLRGSKYLQSTIGTIYKNVKEDLSHGRLVLFSGAPCQIHGLKLFLEKDWDNLITVEVVCHGVPSPALWKKYFDYLEEKNNAKIKSVNFREKRNGWKAYGLLKDGDNILQYLSHREDPYMMMFLKNDCLRESCYKCKAKELESMADMTIADFWGIQDVLPQMDDDKGVSLVMIQTEKGGNLFQTINDNCVYEQVPYESGIAHNSSYYKSVSRPLERDVFFKDMNDLSFGELQRKYCKPKKVRLIAKIKSWIKHILKTKRGLNHFDYGIMIRFEKEKP